MASNIIYVIGVGYTPLSEEASGIVFDSDAILVSKRLNDVFMRYREYEQVTDRVRVINNVDNTLEFLHNNHTALKITVLASGDPLFCGIGRRIAREFGKDSVMIIPDLSSMQVAFSRIKEPWDNALLMSLHGGPDPAKRRKTEYSPEDIPLLLERHGKIAILTDRVSNPPTIAGIFRSAELVSKVKPIFYVCERLGYEDEKITTGSPEEIEGLSFSDPNIVIILNNH